MITDGNTIKVDFLFFNKDLRCNNVGSDICLLEKYIHNQLYSFAAFRDFSYKLVQSSGLKSSSKLPKRHSKPQPMNHDLGLIGMHRSAHNHIIGALGNLFAVSGDALFKDEFISN